ncbi:unnamed protein product [Calypogeia fissa]
MAARAPAPSLSLPTYQHGGGSGTASDPYRARGRNHATSNSGPSSREHSVEGRGDTRRGGGLEARSSADFRASYNNQYQGPMFEPSRRPSGQNWGYGREQRAPNSKNNEFYWRDDRLGVHGRVQGVWEDEDGSLASSGSPSGSRAGYSLTIGLDSQGRRSSTIQQPRQEPQPRYGSANRRPSNGYDGTFRQENGHAGSSQRPSSSHGGGGYRRSSSQSGSYGRRTASVEPVRGSGPGAGTSRVLQGRDGGVPKEVEAFGYGKELETFGSQRSLKSRSTKSGAAVFVPPSEEAKRPSFKENSINGRDMAGNSFKSFKEGDLRRSFANDSVVQSDGWRSSGSSSPNAGRSSIGYEYPYPRPRTESSSFVKKEYNNEDGHEVDDYEISQRQVRNEKSPSIPGGYQADRVHFPLTKDEDGELLVPSPGITKWSAGYSRNHSFERESDFSGELVSPRVSVSSKNSYDRARRRDPSDQLPVFSPSSEDLKVDVGRVSRDSSAKVSRASSVKLSRESSTSESAATRDLGVVGNEDWNVVKPQVPDKTPESASAGMHRTRSTDWYEICLKEEEEEEMLARTRKIEEESNLGNPAVTRSGVRNFNRTGITDQKRGESAVFTLTSARGANYRDTNHHNVEKGWSQERQVRGDALDSAQPNSSSGQRNADSGGKQTLFTPWNALERLPNSRNVPLSAPRSKPGHQYYENGPVESKESGKQENLRICIAGGRQEARGRRSGSIDTDEAQKLRAERRSSRDHSREFVRPDVLKESTAGPSGRTLPIQPNERDGLLASFGEPDKAVPEGLLNGRNGSIRSAAFYRALQEAVTGDDEALPHTVGTCPDMCPSKERLQRERLRDLAVFERVSGDMRKTSKDLAVKKFCRTVVASELESTDVRPLPVLLRTLQYLLGLLDDPEFTFDIIHNFLFDRTRAIRQELGMQRILDLQTVTIHEEIVRFHILSEHELRDLNRKRSKQFDTHLNLQQLSKSLHSLLNLYVSLGGNGGAHFTNEAEFHAYYVLLNLGNHGRFHAEPLSLWFPNIPSHVLEGPPMQFARKALRCYRSNNFIGFFRLVKKATYLQACLMELNFVSVRAAALEMLNIAEYKLHPYPLSDLAEQLILKESEVEELCMYYGLHTGTDNSSQKRCLLAKQGQFSLPESGEHPQHRCPLIDDKRAPSLYQEVKGLKVV